MPYAWEGKGLDEVSAKELHLWIESDGALYDRQWTPIIKNLVAKKARGVYDSKLAAKLFGYLVEAGAKRYNQEVEGGSGRIPNYFPKKVRDAVAEEMRDQFEVEFALGNYDHLTPKKYQSKAASAVRKSKRVSRAGSTPTSLGGIRR